jgi:C4-dicarboxylate transporter DctM subunit
MSDLLMSAMLFGGLFFLLMIGVEVAIAMGIVAAAGLIFCVHQPLGQFAFSAFGIMNSFVLTAMPLFIFMGTILSETGMITRIFNTADKILGHFPGGMLSSIVAANALFGAMSGSSVAATAVFGKIAYPEMERLGYDHKLSLGAITSAGTVAILIPPSLTMIVYGGFLDVSVPRLFAGAIVPGILLTLLFVATITIRVKLNPALAPKRPMFTWRERLYAFVGIIPFILLIASVLGVIFAGIMTPTESAAFGSFLSIMLAVLCRKMTFKVLKNGMMDAVKLSAMITLLLFTARVLGQVFQYTGLTDALADLLLGFNLGKYMSFALICALYLAMGCFFDALSILVLTIPFVSPIMSQLGFNALWFGVLFTVLAEIGCVTPPFGLNLFVLQAVVPKHSLLTVAHGSLPFVLTMLSLIILLTIFPQLVLWLPGKIF